ncbi:uncharacterized protein LOC135351332 [Halichondria panicea]|uniref:uncharacterized protein LOC135351332 n=1 Tax=Halichondria panicea TaxID=6063 RepID=UPI00312B90F2
MDIHELLAAAFTAMLGVEVVSPARGAALGIPKLSVHQLFRATYIMRPPASVDPAERFDVIVKTLTGMQITIPVSKDHTIAEVKAAIAEKEDIHPHEQRLLFDRKTLADHETLQDIGVPPDGIIFLVLLVRGGGPSFQLDPDELAPEFDYDYTSMKDDGKKFMRGAFEYKRPFGWKRYAIKVLGRPEYGNNQWLGTGGIRAQTDGMEWPVSYHGTSMESAKKIIQDGYKIGQRELFGKGVYSSPSVLVADRYSSTFDYEGNRYKAVLQNRINPDPGHMKIVSKEKTGAGDEYWVSPLNDPSKGVHDVRPYNILIKNV